MKSGIIRIKAVCQQVRHDRYGVTSVALEPVRENEDPDGVNKQWWKATPVGRVELTFTNPAAAERFAADAFYFIDISPVTE